MSSDGTPLESLETGDVANAADASRMQAILRDMNASGADTRSEMPPSQPQPSMQPMQAMQSRQPMPPMMPMQPQMMNQNPHYVPVEEEVKEVPKKKNVWSMILEQMRDPLLVSILFFVFALPVFHTHLGKYASWAFAVGGQLSWLGLIALSALTGLVFALLRLGATFLF